MLDAHMLVMAQLNARIAPCRGFRNRCEDRDSHWVPILKCVVTISSQWTDVRTEFTLGLHTASVLLSLAVKEEML